MPEQDVLLSVVIPVYNEKNTILPILERIRSVNIPKEIIIVDDASTDGTREILQTLDSSMARVFFHDRNQGKGAALRTGFAQVQGNIVVVQDADLEYNPEEYHGLLAPILQGKADVVYGSRFMGGQPHRVLFFWHSVANKFLTLLSNMSTNLNLTDMETCYKVFRAGVLKQITIQESRFGFEPEITAKVARMGCRIYEVGISYDGRKYEEGKKIGFRDALRALICIIKYGIFSRSSKTERSKSRGTSATTTPPHPSDTPEEGSQDARATQTEEGNTVETLPEMR